MSEDKKKELKEKRKKIEIFVKYIERLQNILNYFTYIENKGCPFLIYIKIIASKDNIKYELVNDKLENKEFIIKLKQFCNTIDEYQKQFYKENEYFRFIYDKQLYRLYKKTKCKNKDISSYIRSFTNGDSTKSDVPYHEAKFNDPTLAYKSHEIAIKDNFELISEYIENIFKINDTSLKKLYNYTKKRNMKILVEYINAKLINLMLIFLL